MSDPRLHLSEWTLNQMVEGDISPEEHAAAARHIESCTVCAAELAAYRGLFAALADLPRFEPSASFADGVIARTRLEPEPSVFALWLHRATPRTRRGWAFLIAALVTPILPLVAAGIWLLTHPMLTAGALWNWAFLQVRTSATLGGEVLVRWASGTRVTALTEWAYATVGGIPLGALAAILVLFAVGIPLSAWALFHLVRTPTRNVTYAN